MGFFKKNNDINNIDYYLSKSEEYGYYYESADSIDLDFYKRIFGDEKALGFSLLEIAKNKFRINESLNVMVTVFTDIVKEGSNKEINLYMRIIDFLNQNVKVDKDFIWDIKYYQYLSNAFSDKSLILEVYTNIKNILGLDNLTVKNENNLLALMSYPAIARKYYVDDRAVLSSFISLLNESGMRDYLYADIDIKSVIDKKLNEDKKLIGVYDVDQSQLAEMNYKIEQLSNSAESLNALINEATNLILTIETETKLAKDEITSLKISELKRFQTEINKKLQSFHEEYNKLLLEQRDSLSSKTGELFSQLDLEYSKKEGQIKSFFKELSTRTTLEISRLSNATSSEIKRFDEYVSSNETVQRVIDEARENDELVAGLKFVSEQVKGQDLEGISENNVGVSSYVGANIYIPTAPIVQEQRVVDNKINYFFNPNIPFSERFEQILKLKEEKEKNGEIYHEKFDDIIKFIMKGKTPYMYGPSGCGKSYIIEKQVAELLGINVLTNGYVLYEQDILGYTNSATGGYVPGNFYRCYKYGDLIFFDEFDNSIANAAVVLNRFLSSGNNSYTFPDGLITKRNLNFRIVTSGNTNGAGRTLAHNTRQKQDESVMQRLKPIEVNYDNRIERNILINYPDWYNFSINFRKAVELIPNASVEVNTIGTFTTRDAQDLRESLDDDLFNVEQLLQYSFIQTKDLDTLNNLLHKMDNMNYSNGSNEIYTKFKKLIKEKEKRAIRY